MSNIQEENKIQEDNQIIQKRNTEVVELGTEKESEL